VAALGHAVRAGDGRGPATVLRETIVAPFAVRTPEELALAIEGKQIAQASLRLLAPVVFAAAEDGDNVAVGIVHQLADEIVIMVQALMNRLDLTEDATPVVLGGGTLQFGPPVLLNRITDSIRAIAPKAEPRLLDVSPVAGAVLHAMSSAGAGEAAMRKAREGLKDESFSTLTTSG
jgi:N-acetylglucosamine kinase-like BadF-type ATPase